MSQGTGLPLILAVEADERQAAELSSLFQTEVSAELVLAGSARQALAADPLSARKHVWLATYLLALDRLDDNDGIVDYNADSKDEAKHARDVDGKPQ